jgi:hypothetical protein
MTCGCPVAFAVYAMMTLQCTHGVASSSDVRVGKCAADDAVARLAEETGHPERLAAVAVDISNPKSVEAAAQTLERGFAGKLGGLINNAAVGTKLRASAAANHCRHDVMPMWSCPDASGCCCPYAIAVMKAGPSARSLKTTAASQCHLRLPKHAACHCAGEHDGNHGGRMERSVADQRCRHFQSQHVSGAAHQ